VRFFGGRLHPKMEVIMKKNRGAQHAQPQQAVSEEQALLVQRRSQQSDMNDNQPTTRDELAALRAEASSQAAKIDQAFLGFEKVSMQVNSVTVKFDTLNVQERLLSLESIDRGLAQASSRFENVADSIKRIDQRLADLERAKDESVKAQAKFDSQLTVLKYVCNTIAIFVIGAAGHAVGPKLVELISAVLK